MMTFKHLMHLAESLELKLECVFEVPDYVREHYLCILPCTYSVLEGKICAKCLKGHPRVCRQGRWVVQVLLIPIEDLLVDVKVQVLLRTAVFLGEACTVHG